MTAPRTETSPRLKAGIAGALYLVVIISAGFAETVGRGKLIVSGDAAATATNILAHESLYRLGGAADIVNLMCDVAMAVILYDLLRPVSRTIALLSAVYKLMGDAVMTVTTLYHLGALIFLANTPYLNVFSADQLKVQAFESIRFHSQAYNIAMVFFGLNCVSLGYLVYKSTFLPRVVGVVLAIGGTCYVVNSFTRFIAPTAATHLFPYILWPGLVGEVSVALSLLVVGIKGWRTRTQ
jgi:hypothetical protein